MFLITPQIKDAVLRELLSIEQATIDFKYGDSETKYGFKPAYMKMILDQFEEIGLIKSTKYITIVR